MPLSIKKRKFLNMSFLGVSGLAIGFANGFFGGGGGMLLVPLLTFVAKLEEKKSHATAIAIILPLSVLSAVIYTLKGTHDINAGLIAGGGVIAGGVLGAFLLNKLNNKTVSMIFYVLMIAAGIRMIIG